MFAIFRINNIVSLFFILKICSGMRINCQVRADALKKPDFLAQFSQLEKYCTHVTFAYAPIGPDHSTFVFDQFNTSLIANSNIKYLIGVGGWESTQYLYSFSRLETESLEMKMEIQNMVNKTRDAGYHGIVLDWRVRREQDPTEFFKDLFHSMIPLMKAALNAENLVLVLAIDPKLFLQDKYYEPEVLEEYADWIEFLSFDYVYSNLRTAGHTAPLGALVGNADESVTSSLVFWTNSIRRDILSLGVTFEMSAQVLDEEFKNTPFSPLDGNIPNTTSYNIMKTCKQGWTSTMVEGWQAPYAVKGKTWLSFENRESLKAKVEFAKKQGFGGIMIHHVSDDDYSGGFLYEAFPLTKSVYEAVNGGTVVYGNMGLTTISLTGFALLVYS